MDVEAIIDAARKNCAPFTVMGASGFIGTHVCAFLKRHGISFSSPQRSDESIFVRPLGHVIYAIGLTADYAARPFETVEAHVGLLARLLERGQFSSLLYLSSTRLYDSGDGEGREHQSLVLSPENPRHLFDFSKGLGESLCLQTRKNARVARLSSVYAEDLTGENFLYQLIRASTTGREQIDTSPTLSRDYVDVADVVPLLLAIALQGRRRIYNVASGENLTNLEVLASLAHITGHLVVASREAATGPAPRIDVEAIESDFAFCPRSLKARLVALVASARREI